MGKKRIVKTESQAEEGVKASSSARTSKKKLDTARLYVRSTYNNTTLLLTDDRGNAVTSSSSGALGFNGAKKGTPFAAAKVGETVGDRAKNIGVREASVIVSGVGSGRESAIRGFSSKGIQILSIKDVTPVPHNGPRPPKPRRV